MNRYLALLAALALFPHSEAASQQAVVPAWQQVLVIPDGEPLLCRIPTDPGLAGLPRGIIAREFRLGKPNQSIITRWPREIFATFDSAGSLILITDEVTWFRQDEMPLGGDMVLARLLPNGQMLGSRGITRVDTVALNAAFAEGDIKKSLASVKPPVSKPLTTEEQAQVRALGQWLWKRRCPGR